ncbi:response regulator [Pelagicoccus sp. SDUM812005]|uniref:response regulator n=1 Tax=Pelagicoccus sp. SDUM812005 TaxID=3041257 RepID=UPI00280FF04A|nr:response regulator [Pelagicoccus sp. SDUM812005]MDQ8179015.1 response regulator [Pelagicoccus sp. SDUM812005]
MSEPTRKDSAGPLPELPADWRLLLIDKGMKLLAFAGLPGLAGAKPARGLDLADYLADEGLDLAEVGELLVCLEDMPADCELRLRLGNPSLSVVARGFADSNGVSCVVLRPRADEEAERALPAAWAWASWTIRSLGLRVGNPAEAPVHILVVDQNPEVVAYCRTLSRKLGCRSTGAGSGGEALARIKARAYDLVIVDSMIPGMGASALASIISERSKKDWGRSPLWAVMSPHERFESDASAHVLEKPLAMSDLKGAVKLARDFRIQALAATQEGEELAVLNLDIWQEDQALLKRLTKALVAQGMELRLRLSENPSYPDSVDFMKDLTSLKNGCDILHAYRLAEACKDLLDVSQDAQSRRMLARLDRLLVEIEGFRLYAAGRGLLRD